MASTGPFTLHISQSAASRNFRLGYYGPRKSTETDRFIELNSSRPLSANPTHINQPWRSLHASLGTYLAESVAEAEKQNLKVCLQRYGAIFDGESVFSFPASPDAAADLVRLQNAIDDHRQQKS